MTSMGKNFDNTGSSVAISADGSVYRFGYTYDDACTESKSGRPLLQWWNSSSWYIRWVVKFGEARGDNSGRSVALSSDGLKFPYNDINGSETGHVRLYQWDGSWNQLGSDIDGEAWAISWPFSRLELRWFDHPQGAHFNDPNNPSGSFIPWTAYLGTSSEVTSMGIRVINLAIQSP